MPSFIMSPMLVAPILPAMNACSAFSLPVRTPAQVSASTVTVQVGSPSSPLTVRHSPPETRIDQSLAPPI